VTQEEAREKCKAALVTARQNAGYDDDHLSPGDFDTEGMHVAYDSAITTLLRDLGFDDIADLYADPCFWYS
jgi:hypothetical protein